MTKKLNAIKKSIENIAIIMLFLAGIGNVIISLPLRSGFLYHFGRYYGTMAQPNTEIYGVLRMIIGFIILVLSYRLYKRMRFAWTIIIITLSTSIFLHIIHSSMHINNMPHFFFFELIILIILVLSNDDFSRKSDNISVKKAFFLAGFSLALVLITTSIGLFIYKNQYVGINGIFDSFINATKLLFFMDKDVISYSTKRGMFFVDSAIILNWIFIIYAMLLILKPLIYNPLISKLDKEHIYHLVSKFGQNPISYLALENDKKYFFGDLTDGVIAFTTVGDVAICCGDFICAEENSILFLSEFMIFCKSNGLSISFLNVTDKFLQTYKTLGFESVKFGEEACFQLSEYNLAGGKIAKVRAAINHATKLNIKVHEYKPTEHKDLAIEHQINDISKKWLSSKKSSELSFMLGGSGLDNPLDRRYFYASNVEGKMLGFVVFIPYDCKNAYLADVTRRLPDAPQGVLEKIIYDGFTALKAEGVEWGNLGLVPLVNVCENSENKITAKIFEFIYENLNSVYGFKQLFHAKAKFAPTHWISRYIVYYPKVFTPKIAYAIVKAQNPKGLKDYIISTIRKKKSD